MWIKDLTTGKTRLYGTDHHDSLKISSDGKTLTYENLHNGDGSKYGDYRFVTDWEGKIPSRDEVLVKFGADAYFNIGGFDKTHDMSLEEAKAVLDNLNPDTIKALLKVLSKALDCCEEWETSCGAMLMPKGSGERIERKVLQVQNGKLPDPETEDDDDLYHDDDRIEDEEEI